MSVAVSVAEFSWGQESTLVDELMAIGEPMVLRGFVDHWPAVTAARSSDQTIKDYLLQFDQGHPLTLYSAPANQAGRIFYNEDFTGFNFARSRQSLATVLEQNQNQSPSSPMYYVGSTMIKHWLSGFEQENSIDLGDRENLNSIWLGNRSMIAPHFDFPSNIACVVSGRRKFTLFPPDQFENLYVGPFDNTPSGQPISLVDVREPDYSVFPKYREAEAHATVVELKPGDALFIPSMWWHAVEALSDFNVLVNFWWRSTPSYLGSPMAALQHAMLSFKDLPVNEREAWANLFNQLVFHDPSEVCGHIPEHLKGLLGAVNQTTATQVRRAIADAIKT